MISLSFQTLAAVLGIDSQTIPDGVFSAVSINSREACEGRLFVAVKGPNFDGHQFVDAAYQQGASMALVERFQPSEIPQLQVADCKLALGQIANHWRRHCDPCLVALTGSNGKTTVKEMLYQILSQQAPTQVTQGNLNNDIGVPLTLFELSPSHRYAVIEMGANHRGEIAQLAEIAAPDVVYVNNASEAHLSGFGDLQGVIDAKGELYAYCRAEQKALFNADESASRHWRSLCAATTQISCGLHHPADFSARWSVSDDALQITFTHQEATRSCRLAMLGEHNVSNALAAVSLATLAGVEFAPAVDGVSGFNGVKGRQQFLPGPVKSRLIDDSYNANPESLAAGIKVLCSLPGEAWLALGDMAELGDEEEDLHRRAARHALACGVKKLFGCGRLSCLASKEFGSAGYCFAGIEEMAATIRSQLHQEVNLLIKGSRAAGMERLVARLSESVNRGDANAV